MIDKEKAMELADEEEARARLKITAYDASNLKCPTDEKVGKEWRINPVIETLKGAVADNRCPAFVRYIPALHDVVEDLEDTEMLRILRHALRKHVRVQLMEQEEVVRLFFPIHKWEGLQELHKRGWSDPYKPIYFPKLNMPDNVSEYFGAHVAAYFHFYNAFTRWLVIPAVFSAAFPFVRPHIPTHEAHRLDSCFGGFLCIWTTVFLARMKHTMNEKLLRWGMGESVQNVTPASRMNCGAAARKTFATCYTGPL
ncbi:Anoctamin-like protein Os01g0706700 [Durusdinium trenchii]|uniref:Anoctamin-like protein Os01g0706700 n=1 Tax=Durusdinium trenchii TaxID=1381693 RepID=A0ABP0Q3I3_9DINO